MKPSHTTRKPTGEEKSAAVMLAKQLRKVTYPSRAKTKVRTATPPGQVSVREAMQRRAQRSKRMQPTAKPFTQVKRAPTVHTPLKVGIMCDVSGSMAAAQEPLGVARWVLADALHRVQGEVATVLFGTEAHPVQHPKKPQGDVEIYHASGRWEQYVDGFSLIDSALDLIDGDGARLLVIITDGHFVRDDAVEYAGETMAMCREAGVAVLWVDVSGYFAREDDCYGHGSLLDARRMSAVSFARALGDAVVKEFKRVAPQHSLIAA